MDQKFFEIMDNEKPTKIEERKKEVENLLETFYLDNHKNMVFYLYQNIA